MERSALLETELMLLHLFQYQVEFSKTRSILIFQISSLITLFPHSGGILLIAVIKIKCINGLSGMLAMCCERQWKMWDLKVIAGSS